jgi:hypothetical protein
MITLHGLDPDKEEISVIASLALNTLVTALRNSSDDQYLENGGRLELLPAQPLTSPLPLDLLLVMIRLLLQPLLQSS